MPEVLVGLGSNLGDPVENLRYGLSGLAERGEIVAVSSLYRTEPVGYREQDWYLNAAAVLSTDLEPGELLRAVAGIESARGRTREIVNGPRTLDVDLLLYGDRTCEGAPEIPHPRMLERRFVLEPAVEIASRWVHPGTGRTLAEHLAELDSDEAVERVSLAGWPPSIGP